MGKQEKIINSESPSIEDVWIDSLFGQLSEKDRYYQHLIIQIPKNYQVKSDSLSAWIIENQPGGLHFLNWNPDSIQLVKDRLDTLDIIQPFIYCDFFELLDLPEYPYWRANKKNRSEELTMIFSKAGINLLDLGPQFELNETTQAWVDSMRSKQQIHPVIAHFEDKKADKQLTDFLLQLQKSDQNIRLNIERFDTVKLANYRNAYNYFGMFLVTTKPTKVNDLMRGGADLIFKDIGSGDHFSSWKGSTAEMDESTRRILNSKAALKPRKKSHLKAGLQYVRLQLLHNSVALLSDESKMLPLRKRFTIYADQSLRINSEVRKEVGVYSQKIVLEKEKIRSLTDQKGNKVLILSDSVSKELLEFLNKLEKGKNTLVCFSDPAQYPPLQDCPDLLFVPKPALNTAEIFVQQLSERLDLDGDFVSKDSVIEGITHQKSLVARTMPEFVGYDQDTLNRINWAIRSAMNGRAFPGCQVLLAKNGCIIYDKQFGHHSYQRQKVVTKASIYDLASLTKVLSTTLIGMKLWEMGRYDLKDSLYMYLPDSLKKYLPYPSTIRNITFHELFIHKSGLPAGFPLIRYLDYTSADIGRFDRYFCDASDDNFCIEVADQFYMDREQGDSMWLKLNQIWLDQSKPYKYSDVNMNTLYYLFKGIIQNNPRDFGFTESLKKLKEKNLYVEYLYRTFYKPLGMDRTGFKPLERFAKNSIVPTEDETFWRMQLLQGHVHDPNAALMGGVGGNAGLFSTTNDMVKLCQMLLNKGVYDHQRYLKAETVTKFTSVAEDSHRGLGFNKRTISTSGYGMADSCSLATYGHTGFTGTCFWVDPEEDLIYIFLSNRVHPKVNNRIYQYGIRKQIHNMAYAARIHH